MLDQTGNGRWIECKESQNSTLEMDCAQDRSSAIVEGWPLIVVEKQNSEKKIRKRKPVQKGKG